MSRTSLRNLLNPVSDPPVSSSNAEFESTIANWDSIETGTVLNDRTAQIKHQAVSSSRPSDFISDNSISDTDTEVNIKVLENVAIALSAASNIVDAAVQSVVDESAKIGESPADPIDNEEETGPSSEYTPSNESDVDIPESSLPLRKRKWTLISTPLPHEAQSESDGPTTTDETSPEMPSRRRRTKITRKAITFDLRRCSNPECKTTEATSWRFRSTDNDRRFPYCSPCKLYLDANGVQRPRSLVVQPKKKMKLKHIALKDRVCNNCGATETPLWRFIDGSVLNCNACAQRHNKKK